MPHRLPFISVIIPAKNEAARLPFLLARLNAMPEVGEILVCDGGSSDATLSLAQKAGAQIVEEARGRGPQMNAGAAQSNGEWLWFLHADCLPGKNCGAQIINSNCDAGNFRLRFKNRARAPRFFERVARIQRGFGIYYGDSGIWMHRKTWEKCGPFPNWPLFEDYEMARRLKKTSKTACLPGALWASARRFENRPVRILWLWLELQLRFQCGQAPAELAEIYRERSR